MSKVIKLKESDIQRISKRVLKEQNDMGSPVEEQDNDWGQIKRMLWHYERGMNDEELETHVKNLKSHIQEVIYVIHNR